MATLQECMLPLLFHKHFRETFTTHSLTCCGGEGKFLWFISPFLHKHPCFILPSVTNQKHQHVSYCISIQTQPVSHCTIGFTAFHILLCFHSEPQHMLTREEPQQLGVLDLIWRLECSFSGSLYYHCGFSGLWGQSPHASPGEAGQFSCCWNLFCLF